MENNIELYIEDGVIKSTGSSYETQSKLLEWQHMNNYENGTRISIIEMVEIKKLKNNNIAYLALKELFENHIDK